MARTKLETGVARAEAPRQTKEKSVRAAKVAETPRRRSPEDASRAHEAEQTRRMDAAAEAYDDIARAVGLGKEPEAVRAIQARIQERKTAILTDAMRAETKDVSKALHNRMELTALAASLTPEQTDELRSYLDAVDAVDSANAAYMKAQRPTRQRLAERSMELGEEGSTNEKADWMEAQTALKQVAAELKRSGVDPAKYDLGRKSSRDILRNEKLALRPLGQDEVSSIQTYTSALDNADRAHAKAMRAAKTVKRLEASGERGDEWEAAVQEDDAADSEWNAAKKTVGRIETRLKEKGLDPSVPEFKTKAGRTALLRELPGAHVPAEPQPMKMEDYDAPVYIDRRAEAKKRLELISRPDNAPDSTAPAGEWGENQVAETDRTRPGWGETLIPLPEDERTEPGGRTPRIDAEDTKFDYRPGNQKRQAERDRALNLPQIPSIRDQAIAQGYRMPAEPPKNQPTARGSAWSAAKRWGRNALLPLAVMFGLKSVDVERPGEPAPSREESAEVTANMATMAEPMGEVARAPEGAASSVAEETGAEAYLPTTNPENGRVYKKGDPRNLKHALDILKSSGLPGRSELLKERRENLKGALQILNESGLPGKAEYQKMTIAERKAELEAVKERAAEMRKLLLTDSPVLKALEKEKLQKQIDRHESFLSLMKNLREIR